MQWAYKPPVITAKLGALALLIALQMMLTKMPAMRQAQRHASACCVAERMLEVETIMVFWHCMSLL